MRTAHTTEGDVLTAATRLIDDGAEILVAGIGQPTVAGLAELCRERGVALVVAGLGGHVQEDRLPGVLHCTQQQWQASYVMGAWAARHLDGDLFQIVAASHAEDDSVDALQSGFLSVGGSVVGRATTHRDRRDRGRRRDPGRLGLGSRHRRRARRRDSARPTSCGPCVPPASASTWWSTVSVPRTSPWPTSIAASAASTRHPRGAAPTPERSAKTSVRRPEHAADPFAAVGYDAAVLLIEAARRLGHDRPWSLLADVLSGLSVTGARGRMTVDVETGSANTPIVVRRSRAGRNVVVARRPLVSAPPPTMAFTMVGRSPVSYSDEVTDA